MRALFVVLLLGNLTLFGWILVRAYLDDGYAAAVPAIATAPEVSPAPTSISLANEGSGIGAEPKPVPDAGRPEVVPEDSSLPDPERSSPLAARRCEVLGPFIESGPGEGVLQQLEANGVVGNISQLDVPAPSDYWVYYPPLPSRRAAMNQLAEFQGRDIDSFVITQGALVNGVSLGLFTKKASADELVKQMQKLGYPSKIQEVFRSRREFWIHVEYAAGGEPRDAFWADLEARFPLMQRRVESCK